MARWILSLILALSLLPGISGGLLSPLGGAHCDHACCQGQDFCERGRGHEHSAEHGASGHGVRDTHEPSADAAALSLDAIQARTNCRETCGVLQTAPSTSTGIAAYQTFHVPESRSSADLQNTLARLHGERRNANSPRGPPNVSVT